MTDTTLSRDDYLARVGAAIQIDFLKGIFERLEHMLDNSPHYPETINDKLSEICSCLNCAVDHSEIYSMDYLSLKGPKLYRGSRAIVMLDYAATGIMYWAERLDTHLRNESLSWNTLDPEGSITQENLQRCADLVQAYFILDEMFKFVTYNPNNTETSTHKYLTEALTMLAEANQGLADLDLDEVSFSAFTPQDGNRDHLVRSLIQADKTDYALDIARKFDEIFKNGSIQDEGQLWHIERIQYILNKFMSLASGKQNGEDTPKNWREAESTEYNSLSLLVRDTPTLSYDTQQLGADETFSWREFDPSGTITPESLLMCEKLIGVYASLELVQLDMVYMKMELDHCLIEFARANEQIAAAGFPPVDLSILDPKGGAKDREMRERLETRFPEFFAYRLRDEFAELTKMNSIDEVSFEKIVDRITAYYDFMAVSGHASGTRWAVVECLQDQAKRLGVEWQPQYI